VKSLIVLSQYLLSDAGRACGVSTNHDVKTLVARIEAEGISFITISLANFGKDFERSLDRGYVADDMFRGFARHAGLPRFLGGFLQLVFDRQTGVLLDRPSIVAIRAVRQVTLAFGKVSLPCSEDREKAAIRAFLQCEQDLQTLSLSDRQVADFERVARTVFAEPLSKVSVEPEDLVPRHGSGATADRMIGNQKHYQAEWPSRLNSVFPMELFLIPSYRWWEELQDVQVLEPGDERPVKVTLVPKTLKTPRVIAMEPTCMQYAQQALREPLYEVLEEHPLLRGFIGFRDQSPNQRLARLGSLTQELATLDLSEASDRVSNQLAKLVFASHPRLNEAVQACRSTRADVPGHGVIPLAKFASMGSALCFPVEAMVFFTIICLAWEQARGRQFSRQDLKVLAGRVRVYGDDLIVPRELAQLVADLLETYGLKVNRAKSFWNGKFRESCGGDYYDGEWVTPIRVREPLPTNQRNAHVIASTVALRNRLYEAGYEQSSRYLDTTLQRVLDVYPHIPVGHDALGRWTYSPVKVRYVDRNLQVPMIKAHTLRSSQKRNSVSDHNALMKFFTERRGFAPLSTESFTHSGRPEVVLTKPRMVPLHMKG